MWCERSMLSVETKRNHTWVGLFRFLNNALIIMLYDIESGISILYQSFNSKQHNTLYCSHKWVNSFWILYNYINKMLVIIAINVFPTQCSHFSFIWTTPLFLSYSLLLRSIMKKAKEVIFDNYTRNTSMPSKRVNRKNVWIIVSIHSSWKQREKAFLCLPIGKTLLNQ